MRAAKIICAALALAGVNPAFAQLTAGAGRAEIGLTADMLPIDGFTAILDPLQARVLGLGIRSADKSLLYIESATHNYGTCRKCDKVPGQYCDTMKLTCKENARDQTSH